MVWHGAFFVIECMCSVGVIWINTRLVFGVFDLGKGL